MLDPRTAHHLDARVLLALCRNLNHTDLFDVRGEFARFITVAQHRGNGFNTWQDAWNAFTQATPNRPGVLQYTPTRCTSCNGRGFNPHTIGRNLSRTGSPYVCGDCRGTRKGSRQRVSAQYATPPEQGDSE